MLCPRRPTEDATSSPGAVIWLPIKKRARPLHGVASTMECPDVQHDDKNVYDQTSECITLSELCWTSNPLSPNEVAAVIYPLLQKLTLKHKMEESVSQYSVTMSSITLSVASSGHGGLDFTRPPSSECCVHCYAAPEERDAISAHGGNRKRQETDVWRVGIVTLKLLLGHTHTHTHTCPGLVDRASGQLPLLPTGVSLELIDFLMDCLALEPSARPTAEHLLAHELFSDFSTAAPTSVSVCITDCPLDLEGPLDKGDAGGVGESLGHEGELVKGGTLDPPLIAQEVRRQSSRCRPVGVPRLEGVVWLSLTTANFASPYEATARSPCVPIRSNRLRPHTKHLASPYEATARSPCESVRSVRERPARSARDVVGVVDILRSASVVGILRGPRADGIGVRGERCLIEQRGPIGVKRRRRCYMLGVGTAWPRLPVSGV